MQRKGWFIPILVFFISISCLLFYQKSFVTNSLADTTDLPPILWSKSTSDIKKLVFSEFGNTIEALRVQNGWELSKPVKTPADSLYIYNIISTFSNPRFIQTIDTAPTKLADYGITDSSLSITLYDKENEYQIIQGSSADALNYYVYAPLSKTIYTMSKTAFDEIKMELTTWRAKNLFNFEKQQVEKVELEYNGEHYVFTPILVDDKINFTCSQLEDTIATSFVNFLETSKIKDFIVDSPTPTLLESYGFDSPSGKITITLNNGKVLTALLGNVLQKENISYFLINNTHTIVSAAYFDLTILKPTKTSEGAESDVQN